MRKTLLLFALLGSFLASFARPVDIETAITVASKFMGSHDLQLSATYTTDRDVAALYIFNTNDGFVIMSADDCETPIIGYSHEGRFDPNNVPVQMEEYLQDFVARIQYAIENHIEADELTARQWELVKATGKLKDRKDSKNVEPLLTEKWHQGCLYNSLCPEMSGPCDHAEVGCVAVAMGQIMHYWGYPATGWGTHSYNNQGVLFSADFGNTTYDWAHMPDSLTDASSEEEIETVATLLYHCGVAVNMKYGTNGSNANSSDVPDAMSRYFDYSRRIHREKRTDFSDEEWLSFLKNNLDSLRPVYYSGSGNAGGHAFVCDGYDGNDLLHFNWGWGGPGDGYFALGNLNPIGYSFNNYNYAIFDIIPEYNPCVVTVTAYPSTAGTIEGVGEYHIGEQCTLTAIPNENCEFKYWKKDGQIISYDTIITVNVEGDINNYTVYFSHLPVKQIEAIYAPDPNDPNSPYVHLSWINDNTEWVLLKQFDINNEDGVATDGEFIYTSNNPNHSGNNSFRFGKYTFEGELVELFNLNINKTATSLTYDGNYFYCNNYTEAGRMYCVDLVNKTYIGSINIAGAWFIEACTYDNIDNSFWITSDTGINRPKLMLVDRQGHVLFNGPNVINTIKDAGFITAKDGCPHLLLVGGGVYDYDINNNIIHNRPLININNTKGASVEKYEDKDALFVIVDNTIRIYEIKSNLSQIVGYRIYRAQEDGDTIMLADGIGGTTYTDSTWNLTFAGTYCFGISSVFANGNESEIIWSNPIESPFDDIEEDNGNQQISKQTVQKIVENGQVVIIKDGKRYNVSGQILN